jgi:hypothetical protein
MPLVQIDNLETGMVLRTAVCDRSGRLLLPAGSELTDKRLRILRAWGVFEADVEGNDTVEATPPPQADDLDPALVAAAEESVARLFSRNDPGHPAISELRRLCVVRKIRHAG